MPSIQPEMPMKVTTTSLGATHHPGSNGIFNYWHQWKVSCMSPKEQRWAMVGCRISVYGPFEELLRSHECIGWRAMLHGYWSMEWQNEYHKTYNTPESETKKGT
jgi:hypothetical protein